MQKETVVIAPKNRSWTYPALLPLCKELKKIKIEKKKELVNWTWVRLGNPRPQN